MASTGDGDGRLFCLFLPWYVVSARLVFCSPLVMRFLTYNPGGLGRGPRARYKGSWILSYMQRGPDIGAFALQETHCSNIEQLCQPLQDMRLSHHVLHSGFADGDGYAGVCLVISREFEVVNERVLVG